MDLLAGPFFACSLLLIAAGLLKTWRPGTTSLALRSVGLPVPQVVVRAGGAAEAAVGAAAILLGGRWAALTVAASYAVFAAFVVLAMSRGGVVSSCGCLGRPDTPPSWTHVGFNASAAVVSLVFALGTARGLSAVMRDQPLAGLPFLFLSAACGWLGYLVLAVLPTVRRRQATA